MVSNYNIFTNAIKIKSYKNESIQPIDSTCELSSKKSVDAQIHCAFNVFVECIGYLKNRRKSGLTFDFTIESSIQDLLYIMLKPSLPDITFEDPSKKSAVSYSISDIYVPSEKIIIEAKIINNKDDVKPIEKQLNDDLVKYCSDECCKHIMFFIYDPGLYITNRSAFINTYTHETGMYRFHGHDMQVSCVIKP